jgi:carbonic anhydrase
LSSPTVRSKALLEKEGYLVAVVEKWNPHARIRQDLYGFIDLLAVSEKGTIAVQTTSYNHVSERVKKIADHVNVSQVRKAGWTILVHGWHKVGSRWQVRVVDVS